MTYECYRCGKGEFDRWLGAYTLKSPDGRSEDRMLCVVCYYDLWEWMEEEYD